MMLTKTKPDGSWSVVGANGKEIPARNIPAALYGAMCKLHDYEKTGLNPGAIEMVVAANELYSKALERLNKLADELQSIIEGVN